MFYEVLMEKRANRSRQHAEIDFLNRQDNLDMLNARLEDIARKRGKKLSDLEGDEMASALSDARQHVLKDYTQPGDLVYDRDKLLRDRNAAIGAAVGGVAGVLGSVGGVVSGKIRGVGRGMLAGGLMPIGGAIIGGRVGRHLVGARGDRDELDAHVRSVLTARNAAVEDNLKRAYGLKYNR
jgi:hypothetical protein